MTDNKTKILLTGAYGQLGTELRDILGRRSDVDLLALDCDRLDITDAHAVDTTVGTFAPHYIVNAAAYTAVDRAESDADRCRAINTEAVGNIARAAARVGARVVHISTDYVFDGTATRPYRETDTPAPATVYGATKLEGERLLADILPAHSVVLRTAWLYSPHGHNFVKTMMTLGASRAQVNVVDDQIGCPTSATDLAHAVAAVIFAPQWTPGVFHYTGRGEASWAEFAAEVMTLAGLDCRVDRISTDQYPTPARRPAYSVLDTSLFALTYPGAPVADWHTSLALCIKRLQN